MNVGVFSYLSVLCGNVLFISRRNNVYTYVL